MKNHIPAECIDLLHKILELSPKRRISASEALEHEYFKKETNFDKSKDCVFVNFSTVNRSTEATSPCTNTLPMHNTYHTKR
jgi:hypothetical protein